MYFPTCMVYIILKADAFSDAFAAEKTDIFKEVGKILTKQ